MFSNFRHPKQQNGLVVISQKKKKKKERYDKASFKVEQI